MYKIYETFAGDPASIFAENPHLFSFSFQMCSAPEGVRSFCATHRVTFYVYLPPVLI